MRSTASFAMTACVLGLAGLVIGSASAGAPQANCGSLSIGPGSAHLGKGPGARCMLAAYQDHCRKAGYQLSYFGVDTIAIRAFNVNARTGHCGIDVTTRYRVVPQPSRVTGQGR